MYEFEPCAPGQYQYCVEFVGEKSKQGADDYVRFLEDCGYRVFYKNINLNYAVGKVRVRPWANQGGKIATNATTYNRELLIVEKVSDGKPFELHTTYEDKQRDCKQKKTVAVFVRLVCRSRRYIPAKGVVAVCCRRSGRFDCVPGGTGRIEKTGEDTGVKKFDAELRASKKAGSLRVGAAGQPFEMIGAVP